MIRLTYALRRRSSMSREEFQAYWRETHAPLVRDRAETLRIRRYVQAHTLTTPLDEALAAGRGATTEPYDGVAELWWDSVEDLAAAMGTPEGEQAGRELLEDEANFIDLGASPIWVSREDVVVGGLRDS
jgi:uncharacterized protein (TIGR02118 family)